MTLASLEVAKATIKTSGGEFSVRGLSLSDVVVLVRKNRAASAELFKKLMAGGDKSLKNPAALGTAVIDFAPDLAAEIIARAADEPGQVAKVKSLGFPVQIAALERIGELTFESEGGPKKVVEIIIRVVEGTTNLLSDLETSPIGSGVFGGK